MTKLEICAKEDANPGQVYLYPEGAFFKAYQKSAWLLCTRVFPFKVSARPLKGLEDPLLSVGFPQSSLDKSINSFLGITSHYRAYNIRLRWIESFLKPYFRSGYFTGHILTYRLRLKKG